MDHRGIFPFDRVTPSSVRIMYEFRCEKCGVVQIQEFQGVHYYSPAYPEGWTPQPNGWGGSYWYCPKHTVEVTITDKRGG